jgi:hypothetical protein
MYRSAAEEDNFPLVSLSIVSRCSSVSIVSGYGLDDLAIEIRGVFLYPLCPDQL